MLAVLVHTVEHNFDFLCDDKDLCGVTDLAFLLKIFVSALFSQFHQVLLDIGQLLSYKDDRKQDSVYGKTLVVPSLNKELLSSLSSINITSGGTQDIDLPVINWSNFI